MKKIFVRFLTVLILTSVLLDTIEISFYSFDDDFELSLEIDLEEDIELEDEKEKLFIVGKLSNRFKKRAYYIQLSRMICFSVNNYLSPLKAIPYTPPKYIS